MTKSASEGPTPGRPADPEPGEIPPRRSGLAALISNAETLVGNITAEEVRDQDRAAAELDANTLRGSQERSPGNEQTARFVGRVLAGRYRVVRCIGVGGFGAVFEAEDTKIHKQVAVKVLGRDLISDHAMVSRFRQEAEAASKVGHENIVSVTDFDCTEDGFYFLVMEYLRGNDLGTLIRAGEPVSLSRILGIMIQVCRALHAAHELGIVHRDLKPGNIFLNSRGPTADHVKLLDFGISKFMEADDDSSRLTRTGQIIGTPLYMSPEQALGLEQVDHRVDIYSLGVIMYEILTGQPPFTAVNYLGIIAQHASDPPTPPSRVRPDLLIPPEVERIILKAMAKRPEDRYADMHEMEEELISALAVIDPALAVTYSPQRTPPTLLTTDTGLSRRRMSSSGPRPIWGYVASAVAVGLAITLYSVWSGHEPPATLPAADAAPAPQPDLATAARGGPDAAPAPQPDLQAEARVSVRLESTPPGAEILDEQGQLLGHTPHTLTLRRGSAPVQLTLRRAGYRPARVSVLPEQDRVESLILRRATGGKLPDEPKGWGER